MLRIKKVRNFAYKCMVFFLAKHIFLIVIFVLHCSSAHCVACCCHSLHFGSCGIAYLLQKVTYLGFIGTFQTFLLIKNIYFLLCPFLISQEMEVTSP